MQDKNPGEEKTIPDSIRIHEALPRILAMISGKGRIELENFSMEIGDLEFWIPTGTYFSTIRITYDSSPETFRFDPRDILSPGGRLCRQDP